jgi:hypothetical protein
MLTSYIEPSGEKRRQMGWRRSGRVLVMVLSVRIRGRVKLKECGELEVDGIFQILSISNSEGEGDIYPVLHLI